MTVAPPDTVSDPNAATHHGSWRDDATPDPRHGPHGRGNSASTSYGNDYGTGTGTGTDYRNSSSNSDSDSDSCTRIRAASLTSWLPVALALPRA